MKRDRLIGALVVAAVLWTGCGSDRGTVTGTTGTTVAERTVENRTAGPQLVTLTYDRLVGPANVGAVVAGARGIFDRVGLEVTAGAPVHPRRPTRYVSQGSLDFGITQLPQLVLAREKGAPIIAVASLLSEPTASMIWLKGSGLSKIADLEGKTIAIPGVPFQELLLQAVLKRSGLTLRDVRVERVAYKLVPTLLSRDADAIFGGSWSVEGAALRARGADPVIKRVQDLGIPVYDESVVIIRTDFAAENPQAIRAFLAGVLRGNTMARRSPEAAAKIIVDNPESRGATLRETKAGLRATLPLLSRSGYVDLAKARRLVNWMYEEGLTKQKQPVAELLTNDYLPSQP